MPRALTCWRAIILFALLLVACRQPGPDVGGEAPSGPGGRETGTVPGAHESGPAPASPSPNTGEPRVLIICMAGEPQSLVWSETALVTQAVLEAVQEPLIDTRAYDYQPNLVEKLPSFQDGDAVLEEVTITEGERFYDLLSGEILTLSQGMTQSFALSQFEGAPLTVERWDGSPLPTVQLTAYWTLHEGLTWQDGTPVTADDSVFAFAIARDPAWPSARDLVDRTESYLALGARTLQWRGIPGYVDGTYFLNVWRPQPRHLLGDRTATELRADPQVNRAPLSYGPYKIDEWVSGERIVLSRNDAYFRGPPPLDQLIFRFVEDTIQLVNQVAAGECDVGTQDAAFESVLPVIRRMEEQGLLRTLTVAGTAFEHLDFNTLPVEGYEGAAATLRDSGGGRLFANPDFRRAVAYCLDRETIAVRATNGAAFVQHVYTADNHPLYPGDGTIQIYDFDPQRGRELLRGLGWSDTDGDGILDDGAGTPLSFNYSTRRNPLREKVTQIVQRQLRDHCGIETRVEFYGTDYFADGPDGIIFGRSYDLGEFAWLTGVEPPCDLYLSSQIPSEQNGWGAANNTGFSHPEFDAACNLALQTLDEALKAQKHGEAMALFTRYLPSLPLFARAKIALVRPEVEGVVMDPTANSELWNVENFDVGP